MNSAKIMIVDDDVTIGNMLQEALEGEGYSVLRAYSGTEAVMLYEKSTPDLVLLDLNIPGLPGEQVLPIVKNTPTIVVSARSDTDLKVGLLYEGAVDYVTKPFVISELIARIAVALRISSTAPKKNADAAEKEGTLTACGVNLDPDLLTAKAGGSECSLTRTETAILQILMLNAERPMGRSTILDRISDSTPDCTERSLKQHISNIRKKLEALDGTDHIEAIYGIGFRFH